MKPTIEKTKFSYELKSSVFDDDKSKVKIIPLIEIPKANIERSIENQKI
jgi:hypothetical protein